MSQTHNRVKRMALAACLAALSIVFGKFLALNLTPNIRLSLENLPILLAGMYFGPVTGAAVGAAADLVGCFLVGYTVNPIITAGAALIGLCAGVFGMLLPVKKGSIRVLFTVIPAHLLGSVIVKTIGLIVFYGSPPVPTFCWRLLTYAVISALEISILYLLTSNRAFNGMMRS